MVREPQKSYEFGPFSLIPGERQLLRDGAAVALTPKAFDLLVVLVESSGHLLEKGELLERIWPDSFVEEGNLTVKMSELRRALAGDGEEVQYIETVPRRGYRFTASVKEVEDNGARQTGPSVETSEDETPIAQDSLKSSMRPWSWAWLLLTLPVLAALLFGLNAGGVRERLLGSTAPAPISSLAVLPLEDLSGDAAQEYFADGMTESLITNLAKIRALRVISRPSVIPYKGVRKPMHDIGRELNVDALLTGSVLRAGERVRISVQLIHAATDRTLWSESYERDLRDVLGLQREVARDVGREVRITLTPQEQVRLGGARAVDPAAYDHYLRGKYHLHRQVRDSNEIAIASLEEAVAADPTFATAHAELAQAYVWKLFLFQPDEPQLGEKAFVSAEKALELDPELAVAYLARGRLLWTPANRFPHESAMREYRRALELDPNLDEARNQLALVYNHVGAFDEALRELEQAVATNPGNSLAQFRIGETRLFQGKFEHALADLRRLPKDVNPALVGHQIVWALFNLGQKDEAEATLQQFMSEYPDDNRGLLTSLQAVFAASEGNNTKAEELIQLAVKKGQGFGHFHHTAYHIACAYARMNQAGEAVRWLKVAAETGFPCYPLFEADPNLNRIRHHPHFVAFMSDLRRQWEHYRSIL